MNCLPPDIMLLPPILTVIEAIEIEKKHELSDPKEELAPLCEISSVDNKIKYFASKRVVSTSPIRTASIQKKRFSIEVTVSPEDSPAAITRRNSAARLSRSQSGGARELACSSDESTSLRKS